MSDPTELREQCKHGRYDPHYWSGPKTKLRSGHSVDQQVPLDWCPGGKEIVLTQDDDRLLGLAALWLAPDQDRLKAQKWFIEVLSKVWIEVSDE